MKLENLKKLIIVGFLVCTIFSGCGKVEKTYEPAISSKKKGYFTIFIEYMEESEAKTNVYLNRSLIYKFVNDSNYMPFYTKFYLPKKLKGKHKLKIVDKIHDISQTKDFVLNEGKPYCKINLYNNKFEIEYSDKTFYFE